MRYATAAIPVDLKSPGQVLACMGFLEAAEVLLGGVEAHFDWSEAQAMFVLRADGDDNPFVIVLEFLSNAKISKLTPIGYVEGCAADGDDDREEDAAPGEREGEDDADDGDANEGQGRALAPAFPAGEGERNALPIQLERDGRRITVSHWAEARKSPHPPWLSRDDFKLYSGNRSAIRIATQMLQGVRAKPRKHQSIGDLKSRGLQQLWQEQREELLKAPFDVVTPMGGSFNFDPRGAWTAIDAGYSPNTQNDRVAASPVVEILAAIGLEHARPHQYETRRVRYAVWGHSLPPMLGRAALAGADLKLPMRRFEFKLDLSGKNKVTTFAKEETRP
jgi:CRISPR-associated protein Csx14